MLRVLLAALLLANLLFLAWSQGALDGLTGHPARGDREPQRLALQVRPERVTLLSPEAAASAASAAAAAAEVPLLCLEAGPFGPAEVAAAQAAASAALPAGRWTDRKTETAGSWLLFMGPYPNRETVMRKQQELGRIRGGVTHEEVSGPPLTTLGNFGLSLGRFASRDEAVAGLADLNRRGVRTARIVEQTAAGVSHHLRVDKADPALVAKLGALKEPALGKGFVACPAG